MRLCILLIDDNKASTYYTFTSIDELIKHIYEYLISFNNCNNKIINLCDADSINKLTNPINNLNKFKILVEDQYNDENILYEKDIDWLREMLISYYKN